MVGILAYLFVFSFFCIFLFSYYKNINASAKVSKILSQCAGFIEGTSISSRYYMTKKNLNFIKVGS